VNVGHLSLASTWSIYPRVEAVKIYAVGSFGTRDCQFRKGGFAVAAGRPTVCLRRILYLLRRAERVLLFAPRRTVRLVLGDFVRTVRLSLRRTGFTLALVAFFATWPRAATCPSVEPIFSATVTKTCFSLSTKLALFICSPSGGFCLTTPRLSWLV
jgi:hypothetical protein